MVDLALSVNKNTSSGVTTPMIADPISALKPRDPNVLHGRYRITEATMINKRDRRRDFMFSSYSTRLVRTAYVAHRLDTPNTSSRSKGASLETLLRVAVRMCAYFRDIAYPHDQKTIIIDQRIVLKLVQVFKLCLVPFSIRRSSMYLLIQI